MTISLCTIAAPDGSISDAARALTGAFDELVVVPDQAARPDAERTALSKVRTDWSFWLEPEEQLGEASRSALEQLITHLPEMPHRAYRMRCRPLTTARRLADADVQVRLRHAREGATMDSDIVLLRSAPADGATLRMWSESALHAASDPLEMATHLLDLGRMDEAIDMLKRCDVRASAWIRAHALARSMQPGPALHALHFVDRSTRDPLAYALLDAQVRVQLGDATRARAGLERAVGELTPHPLMTIDEVQALTLLGECRLVDDDLASAALVARGLVAARPDYGPAWFLLVDALIGAGDFAGVEELEQRLSQVPGTAEAVNIVHAARVLNAPERATGDIGLVPVTFLPRLKCGRVPMLSCMYPWRWSMEERTVVRRRDPPKVSLTMIVRDEEHNLGECLETVVDLVDELVVVDTGSKDATCSIAEHFGASVPRFPWCDDFSAARNVALDHAHGDWVFVLDADDRLLARDREKLRALFASLPDDDVAYCLCRVSLAEDGQVGREIEQALLFRRRPDVRWEYRVHEQITPSLMRSDTRFEVPGICVIHTGYRNDQINLAKAERNYRIVRKDLAEHPDDPFLHFALGTMLVDLERYEEAVDALLKCKPTVAAGTEMDLSLAIGLARSYTALGRERDALGVVREARTHSRGHAGVALAEAELCVQLGDLPAAAEALADLPYHEKGRHDAPHARALMLLAEILLHRKQYVDVEKIGATLINTRPAFGGGWFVSADALLARGDDAGLATLVGRMSMVRGAEGARAVVDAARLMLIGDRNGARKLVDAAVARDSLAGILAVVRGRIECGGVPFASCSAPPWVGREVQS